MPPVGLPEDVWRDILPHCDRNSLHKLILTSWLLFKLATELVWTDVRGIDRLLRALPDDWFLHGYLGSKVTRLNNPPPETHSAWNRVKHYASHIVSFEIASEKSYLGGAIDDSCYLAFYNKYMFLKFPKLKHLVLSPSENFGMRHYLALAMRMMLNGSIASLNISLRTAKDLNHFLPRMESFPQHDLKRLSISTHFVPPETLFQTIARFDKLEDLELTYHLKADNPISRGIHLPCTRVTVEEHHVLPLDKMQPLFKLAEIRRFALNGLFSARYTDLEPMARGWKKLRSLILETADPKDIVLPSDLSQTLRVWHLASLLELCPDLQDIHVRMPTTTKMSHEVDWPTVVRKEMKLLRSVGGNTVLRDEDFELLKKMLPFAEFDGLQPQ